MKQFAENLRLPDIAPRADQGDVRPTFFYVPDGISGWPGLHLTNLKGEDSSAQTGARILTGYPSDV
jgi:hypothetical protein